MSETGGYRDVERIKTGGYVDGAARLADSHIPQQEVTRTVALGTTRAPAVDSTFCSPSERRPDIAALGSLSASIVHDLRNPLATIYAGAETLLKVDTLLSDAKRLAKNIHNAAARIQDCLPTS
jgi:signal transduction histidine kinase